MTDFLRPANEFLRQVIAIIEENLADEHFGVPELAEQVHMSRSNLLRKVKSITGDSVSVFIRKVRLYRAKEMLGDDRLTASEVCFRVGFSSASYFTKCFREEFGYTPGEEKRTKQEPLPETEESADELEGRKLSVPLMVILGVIISATLVYLMITKVRPIHHPLDKSIAVLPFKNDSNDSSNVYIINGLMEAILNNLQKVEDLKVTSRTSVEKYRNTLSTIPELAEELDVSYFVEGSGQKIGDEIVLTVQLIQARLDRHVWSKSYRRQANDIFKLQTEVAQNIAEEIEAIITPEEQERIAKVPTENMVAYDYYLKGIEQANKETREGLFNAIELFKKAIEEDGQFAKAYAYVAICYYYIDIYQTDKKYGDEINTYADKALLLDSDLAESLVAKAMYYMQDEQYELAAQYFEKVLTYYPNSGRVHNYLSDIYTSYLPNTQKYLMHALQGIKTAVASQDSVTASFSYLHLSNALAQTGFIKESEKYIKKSLAYNPHNLYSQYVYTYIKLAENFDLERAKNELISIYHKDTTRLDVIQEVAKICYMQENYKEAWKYYNKFVTGREKYQLDIFRGEDIKIGFVLDQLGRHEEALTYYSIYKKSADEDKSQYKELMYAAYDAVNGTAEGGMTHLKAFAQQKDYIYWMVLFMDKDPIIRQLSTHPDYEPTLRQISENFWERHKETAKKLEEEGVI